MTFGYAIDAAPVNGRWREVRLAFQPFQLPAAVAVPDIHVVARLYCGPWPRAPLGAVDLGHPIWYLPRYGSVARFNVSDRRAITGVAVAVYARGVASECQFYVAADLDVGLVRARVEELGASALALVGRWHVGAWTLTQADVAPAPLRAKPRVARRLR